MLLEIPAEYCNLLENLAEKSYLMFLGSNKLVKLQDLIVFLQHLSKSQ